MKPKTQKSNKGRVISDKKHVSCFTFHVSSSRGFTLFEVLVSVSIFAVAMVLVAVVYLDAFVGQRKVIAFTQANSNARLLMDTLSREIRVSRICGNVGIVGGKCDYTYQNPASDTPGPINAPSNLDKRLDIIRGPDGVPVSYCINQTSAGPPARYEMKRLVNNTSFSLDPCTNAASQVISSPEVVLYADSGFITEGVGQVAPISGSAPCDANSNYNYSISSKLEVCQPSVTIMLHVHSYTQRNVAERSDVQVQTTLSQRLIDIP